MKRIVRILFLMAAVLCVWPTIASAYIRLNCIDPTQLVSYPSGPAPICAPVISQLTVAPSAPDLGYNAAAVSFNTSRGNKWDPITASGSGLFSSASGMPIQGTISFAVPSPDDPVINILLSGPPSIGSVSFTDQNGSFIYTPGSNPSIRVGFAYLLVGAKGDATYGTTTLDVGVNDGPAPSEVTISVPFNQSTTVVLPFASDTVISSVQPVYGALSWAAGNSAIYTPPTGFSGRDTFLFYLQLGPNTYEYVLCVANVQAPSLTSSTFEIYDSNSHVTFSTTKDPSFGNSLFTLTSTDKTMFPTDGHYTAAMSVTDAGGNSASGSSNVHIDNTPPHCSWITPLSNATVSGTIASTVDATDNLSGVRGMDFTDPVDSHHTPFVPIASTTQWLYSSYDTREKEGSIVLQATVYDVAGNANTCAQPITVNNVIPTGSLDFGSTGVPYNGMMLVHGANTMSATSGSGASDIASVALSIDGNALASANAATVSFPFDTTLYADGAHTILATFKSNTGTTGTAQRQILIDNTPPLVNVSNLVEGAVIVTSLPSITATVAESNGVASKKVFIDGVSVAFSEQNNVLTLATPVTAIGSHTLSITAQDTVGNTGQVQCHFTIVNPDPPTAGDLNISLGSLTDGSVLPSGSGVTITSIVSGGSGALTAVARIDGSSTPLTVTAGPGGTYNFSVDTKSLTDGAHTLKVDVQDEAGHATSASVTVTVDNSAPSVTNIIPIADNMAVSSISPLQASATDVGPSGLTMLAIYVDGQLVNSATSSGAGSTFNANYSLDPALLSEGSHSIEYRATDRANNVTSVARTINVSHPVIVPSAPVVTIISPTEGLSESGGFYAKVSATNNPDIATLSIDGGVAIPLNSIGSNVYQVLIDVTQFAQGQHTFVFTATNAGGSASQTVHVYFNRTPPTISSPKLTPGATLALVQTLVMQAADPSGRPLESLTLKINGTTTLAAFPGNTDPTNTIYSYQWDTQNVPDGDYTLTVIAKDQSGLTTQTTIPFKVNNTNIPVSEAVVQFLYSNMTSNDQSVPFVSGSGTAIKATITNANWDVTAINAKSFQVYATKNGEKKQITGNVSVDGNKLVFLGPIPDNCRVSSVLNVLDAQGKVIRRTADAIFSMSAEKGGMVTAVDGSLKLTVPPHSLPNDALVELSLVPVDVPVDNGASPSALFSQFEVVYGPFQVTGTDRNGELQLFASPSTMVFERNAQQTTPLDAGRVDRAERYDASRHVWTSLDDRTASVSNAAAPHSRTISAPVTTFGIYRIAAIPQPGDGVTELSAYPSPLRAGAENATIAYLLGENADADLTIYDVFGSLVRHFHFSAGSLGGRQLNEVPWDGRNGSGDPVANGVYIIQVNSTGHRARTKIGVAR